MFNFIIYADDTILNFSDSVQNKSTESVINEELLKIVEWLNINKLSLNKSKSKYITFQMSKKIIYSLIIKIDNIVIEKVEEFNFLSLSVDTNLNWKKKHKFFFKYVFQNYRNIKQNKTCAIFINFNYFI